MKIDESILPSLAELAAADFSTLTNPRSVGPADYLALYRAALSG